MSLRATRETSCGRSFVFSNAFAITSVTGRRDLDPALDLVISDLKTEGLEDLPLQHERSLVQRLAEVWQPPQGVLHLVRIRLRRIGTKLPERRLGLFLLGSQLAYPPADQLGLEPLLERVNLKPDPPLEVGHLTTKPRFRVFRRAFGLSPVRAELALELVESHRAEDPLGEEALDQRQQHVLTDVEPFSVLGDLGGGLVT